MSDNVIISRSPQDADQICAEVRATQPGKVASIVPAVRDRQREWWATSPLERSTAMFRLFVLLEERAERFVDTIVAEVGKPLQEARGEVDRALALAKYYSQFALKSNGEVFPAPAGGRLLYERRPRGVAGIITPWNFPFAIPMWKLLPALAAGNGAVLKPSSQAVATAELFAEALDEALGGLVEVVPGGSEVATAIIELVDVVSFTGSTEVGRSVVRAAAGAGIPVQAEMGGHNPAIVLEGADIHAAARDIAYAAMGYAGQKCTATRRAILVGPPVWRDQVQEAIVSAVEGLGVGDPSQAGISVGPLINVRAKEQMHDALRAALDAGGEVLTGGVAGGTTAPFARPTVIRGLDPLHPVSQQETFAPLLQIQEVESDEAAIALANGTDYGLVASVHGNDLGRINRLIAELDAGMIKVNAPTTGVDFFAPFGGEEASSYGQREQGSLALEFYSSPRTITFGVDS